MIRPKQGIQFFADFMPASEVDLNWYLDGQKVKTESMTVHIPYSYTSKKDGNTIIIDCDDDTYSYTYAVDIEDEYTSLFSGTTGGLSVYAISKSVDGGGPDTVSNLIVNGTTVKSVIVNDTEVNTVVANGTTVFSKTWGVTNYTFDVTSVQSFMTTSGSWNTDSEGPYYYSVFPLQKGLHYKVTLPDATKVKRFRLAQSADGVIGNTIKYVGPPSIEWPLFDGAYINFIAEYDYCIVYAGSAGAEANIEVTTKSNVPATLANTKWKMLPTANWYIPQANLVYNFEGAFYEGNETLTDLASSVYCHLGFNHFMVSTSSSDATYDIENVPSVDSVYANHRWRVYRYYGGAGTGFIMRDLTDTLYLDITCGTSVEDPELITWLMGAAEQI